MPPAAAAGPSKKHEQPARLKLVVRRLPPVLPEDIFWNATATWVNDKTCVWKRYVKGRAGDGRDQRPVFSRAYVLMNSPEALVEFHRHFDGHVFRSKAGDEFQAVVEFAPVQKTPYRAKVKVDARQGTIDDDPDYKSFLESLTAPPTKPVLETSAPPVMPTTTPLLDHLRAHGRPGKNKSSNKKAKTNAATETSAKDAALASVSKAAAKRAPLNQSTAVLVAGKGRDVKPAPGTKGNSEGSGVTAGESSGTGGKKGKGRKKGKGDQGKKPSGPDTGTGAGAGGDGGASTEPVKQVKIKQRPTPATAPATDKAADPKPLDAGQKGKERGVEAGGGGGGGGRRGRGRGAGSGGGAQGGGRSAHGAVMAILTKNATEGDKKPRSGRGKGGNGGGKGKEDKAGGGDTVPSSSIAASQARIDA